MKPTMLYLRYDLRKLNKNKCSNAPDKKRCKAQATRLLLFYELRNPRRVEAYGACEDHWATIKQVVEKSHRVEWLGGSN